MNLVFGLGSLIISFYNNNNDTYHCCCRFVKLMENMSFWISVFYILELVLDMLKLGLSNYWLSCLSLKLGICVRIPVGAWLDSPNAWMRGEEIARCKSHITSVSLTDWCIMIFKIIRRRYVKAARLSYRCSILKLFTMSQTRRRGFVEWIISSLFNNILTFCQLYLPKFQ